jgi:hypothetical protein
MESSNQHFDETRFFNPGQPSTDRGLVDVLRWRLTSAAARWPKSVPVTPAKPDERVSGLRTTMVGHASTLIQVAGVNILTDPVWSERAGLFSFVGPKRVTKPGIDFETNPRMLPPLRIGSIFTPKSARPFTRVWHVGSLAVRGLALVPIFHQLRHRSARESAKVKSACHICLRLILAVISS